ncbi:MAG TPA: restriction endonuclease [Syntrophothermus lipocalidus]|nr:restriction endonuclease [Syntrophothermus lipocalidus]
MEFGTDPFDQFMYFFRPLWQVLTHKFFLMLYALAIMPSFIRWLVRLHFNARARRTGVDKTDRMSGREFEQWLSVKFKQMGYKVQLQRGFKDKGADLILQKGPLTIAVQAKKLAPGRKVGVKVLGEVLRAMKYYKAPRGIVVTNQYFTREIIEEASGYTDVQLWDRPRLIREIEKLNQIKTVAVTQTMNGRINKSIK